MEGLFTSHKKDFMAIDQDRPSSWVKFKDEYCASCAATCCTMPVEVKIEDLVQIGVATEDDMHGSPKKLANRLARDGIVKSYRSSSGLFLLQQKNGRDCVFLDKNRRCSVYERRPGVCRGFPKILGPRIGFCPYTKKIL